MQGFTTLFTSSSFAYDMILLNLYMFVVRSSYYVSLDIRKRASKRGIQPPVDNGFCSYVLSAAEQVLNMSSPSPTALFKQYTVAGGYTIAVLVPDKHLIPEVDHLQGISVVNLRRVCAEMPIAAFREYIKADNDLFCTVKKSNIYNLAVNSH